MDQFILERATSVFKMKKNRRPLRTQIPVDIAKMMGLSTEHNLIWRVQAIDGKIQISLDKALKGDECDIAVIDNALDTMLGKQRLQSQ
jgi:hypothetical protein